MTDMRERVARAIWGQTGKQVFLWQQMTPAMKAEFYQKADAAIAALEPVQEVTTQRALEIVLSRCKMDNGTAHVLKGLLGYARDRALAERGE